MGMQEPRGRGMWGCRMGDAGQLPGMTSPVQAFTCLCQFPGERHLEALARTGTCAPRGHTQVLEALLPPELGANPVVSSRGCSDSGLWFAVALPKQEQ